MLLIKNLETHFCMKEHYCNKCNVSAEKIINDDNSSRIFVKHQCPKCKACKTYLATQMHDGSYISRAINTGGSIKMRD